MNVEVVQRRLWKQSQQHRKHRESDTPLFPINKHDGRVRNLMDLMHQPQWIAAACDRVLKRSRGKAAGVDRVTASEFQRNRRAELEKLRLELKRGTYQPQPLRRVMIPKANGKLRGLGIPCLRDKIVQEVIRMALEPVYEAEFHESSYGFRPNRSTHHAIFRCQQMMHRGFTWVIEGDVKACFDEISHRAILGGLREKVMDNKFLDLIRRLLKAGVKCLRKYGRGQNRISINEKYMLIRAQDISMSWRHEAPAPYAPGTGCYLDDVDWEAESRRYEQRRPGCMDLKAFVLFRDGHRCRQCGTRVTHETSQADHIQPVNSFASYAQATTLLNLQTLCLECHKLKTYAK